MKGNRPYRAPALILLFCAGIMLLLFLLAQWDIYFWTGFLHRRTPFVLLPYVMVGAIISLVWRRFSRVAAGILLIIALLLFVTYGCVLTLFAIALDLGEHTRHIDPQTGKTVLLFTNGFHHTDVYILKPLIPGFVQIIGIN